MPSLEMGRAMLRAISMVLIVAFAAVGANGTLSTVAIARSVENVATLLHRAREAIAAGRLVRPAGSNALELYLLLLEAQPQNSEASAAIYRLRSDAAGAAAIAADHGDIKEEQRLRNLVVRVDELNERRFGAGVVGGRRHSSSPSAHSPPVESQPLPPRASIEPDSGPHTRASEVEPLKDLAAAQAANDEHTHSAVTETPPPRPKAQRPNVVDSILQGLPWGEIAFNTPRTMTVGREETIHVVLSGTATADELKKMISETGPVEADRIQIFENLHVELSGTAFEIALVGPEIRGVGYTHTAEWLWHVTPKERGAQHLDLTVNVIVKIDGEDREVTIKTFEKDIEVDVDTGDAVLEFIQRNWQWLWATLLVPLSAGLWRYMSQRKRKRKKPR